MMPISKYKPELVIHCQEHKDRRAQLIYKPDGTPCWFLGLTIDPIAPLWRRALCTFFPRLYFIFSQRQYPLRHRILATLKIHTGLYISYAELVLTKEDALSIAKFILEVEMASPAERHDPHEQSPWVNQGSAGVSVE
jgi:hypothetical protein